MSSTLSHSIVEQRVKKCSYKNCICSATSVCEKYLFLFSCLRRKNSITIKSELCEGITLKKMLTEDEPVEPTLNSGPEKIRTVPDWNRRDAFAHAVN